MASTVNIPKNHSFPHYRKIIQQKVHYKIPCQFIHFCDTIVDALNIRNNDMTKHFCQYFQLKFLLHAYNNNEWKYGGNELKIISISNFVNGSLSDPLITDWI